MLHLSVRKRIETVEGPRQLEMDLTLAPGERLALFGPSGAGKSTLLRMVAGLTDPDAGVIRWGTQVWFDSARGFSLPARLRGVGMQFQEPALFPHMTVAENLAFAQPRPDPVRLRALLARAELEPLADRYPAKLSGGQKQRVALVRALAREPELLLLDEPLSAQDGALRARLRHVLDVEMGARGVTTLLVSHEPGEIFRLADRVMRLEQGAVAAMGSPARVLLGGALPSGRHTLHGSVVQVEEAGVMRTVTVAVGADLFTALATPEETAGMEPGERVRVQLNGGSAVIRRDNGEEGHGR